MSSTMQKQLKDILKLAREQGWRVEQSRRSSHYILLPPQKDRGRVVLPLSPSDPRSVKNAISLLRKAGLQI